jgi:uncharacterized repeat protein (TIGR01451 family)
MSISKHIIFLLAMMALCVVLSGTAAAQPSVDINKSTNGEDADTAPGPMILVGETVTWTYVVNNTGNESLTNVTVVDDQQGNATYQSGDTNTNNILDPGEVWIYNLTGTATAGQYENNATVTALNNSTQYNDTDPSHYFGANPQIDIEKSTNGQDADTPSGPSLHVGDTVTWTYEVNNTGNVNMTNINVTDDQEGNATYQSGDNSNGILEPGEVWIYNLTGTATLGQYENNATVTGIYNGTTYSDYDLSHYTGLGETEIDLNFSCWDPCGTKVFQCDQDNTFALEHIYPANVVISSQGTYYIDLTPLDSYISEGDLRITSCNSYEPNTVVGFDDGGGDAGKAIVSTLSSSHLVCYVDLKGDGFDIEDPLYFNIDGNNNVSSGDIRITASPALNVYNETGGLVWAAGAFGGKWTVVALGDEDRGDSLEDVGTGNLTDLIRYMDADCDGEWSEGDKLYLNQPYEEPNEHFDDFVTIGDTRLYVSEDDECDLECGTKVIQNESDVTYALILFENSTDAPLVGIYAGEEVYLNMDGDGIVSVGDIRLSNVSTTYDPNSMVESGDTDLGHALSFLPSDVIRYYDFDGNGGYSLGDPLYIDLDNDNVVSDDDIRLTQVPVVDTGSYTAGQVGMQWSVVFGGPLSGDADVGWELEKLLNETGMEAELWELLGYVDSDCSGDWNEVDKLYLQQIVNINNENGNEYYSIQHNMFVTVGDLRFYVPPEAIQEENWYACGTKVMPCNTDVTHALYYWEFLPSLDPDVGFFDKNDNDEFDVGEAAYLDMDGSGNVSIGDVRLTEAICWHTNYSANTKVLDQHAEDLEHDLNFGPGYGDGIFGFGYLFFVDLNDNDAYDVTDPLYIETDFIDLDAPNWWEDVGPSPGDIRLTQVPVVNDSFGTAGSIGAAFSQVELADGDTEWLFYHYADPAGLSLINPVENSTFIFDVDCSGDWTCNDMLYLAQITELEDLNHTGVVTAGDLRLYIPEEFVSTEEPGPQPEYNPYDTNENHIIEMEELMQAIEDWQTGSLSMEDLMVLIDYYNVGSYS